MTTKKNWSLYWPPEKPWYPRLPEEFHTVFEEKIELQFSTNEVSLEQIIEKFPDIKDLYVTVEYEGDCVILSIVRKTAIKKVNPDYKRQYKNYTKQREKYEKETKEYKQILKEWKKWSQEQRIEKVRKDIQRNEKFLRKHGAM